MPPETFPCPIGPLPVFRFLCSETCWLERVTQVDAVWWVKVKLSNGTVGWIKDPYDVNGAYGC